MMNLKCVKFGIIFLEVRGGGIKLVSVNLGFDLYCKFFGFVLYGNEVLKVFFDMRDDFVFWSFVVFNCYMIILLSLINKVIFFLLVG